MSLLRTRGARSPAAWATLSLTLLAALAIALPATGTAASTVTWTASVGAGGANGKATMTAPATAGTAGTLKLALKGLSASTAYPVKIAKGTCAAPGTVLYAGPTQTSTAGGKIAKSLPIPAAKMNAIRLASSVVLRVGTGSKLRCGPFTGGPQPSPTAAPTPTPEPSLAATIGVTGHAGTGLYDIAADASQVWAVEFLMGYAHRIDPATGNGTTLVDYTATLYATFGCALGAGALWVPTNRLDGPGGTVIRIDTATNTIPARIEVPGRVFGVTTGGGAVWVAQAGPDQLVKIDPAKNAVAKVYPLKSAPTGVAYGNGYGWVLSGTKLLKVDLANSDVFVYELGGKTHDIAFVDGSLWVTTQGTGTSSSWKLLRISAETGAVVATIDVPGEPWDVAGDAGYVWVAPNDEDAPWAVAVSTASNRIVASVTLPKNLASVAVAGRHAWFVGIGDLVVRVDY
jgi:hypothetical protein